MDAVERSVLEDELRRLLAAGDHAAATTLAIRGYGPEVLGFLVAIHRNENDADDAFSLFCENLWQALPRFEQRSSFRTWLYALARHAYSRVQRKRASDRRRLLRLDDVPGVEEVAQQVRTSTLSYLRSQARSRLVELRQKLPIDDQALLVLRLDRKLEWNELALAFHDGEGALDGKSLKRESARLRKRFQLVKDRLLEELRALGDDS